MSVNTGKTSQDIWQQAFPFDEARRAAGFLVQTWHEMTKLQPAFFHSSKREAELTERLHYYTDIFSLTKGRLIGFWVNENPAIKIDETTGGIIDRVRKDITYFSNVGDFRLELIFEFKKLFDSSASRSAYTREQGMQRFTSKRYGKDQPLSAMVGIIIGDQNKCIQKLRKYMQRDDAILNLHTLLTPTGEICYEPSQMFPSLANFDTKHRRGEAQESTLDNIYISHFFLTFQ